MTAAVRGRLAAVLTIATVIAGCRKASEPPPPAAEEEAAAPGAAPPSTDLRRVKVSVHPDTIDVRNGHAENGTYELGYELTDSDRVTKAEMAVYVRGIGFLQKGVEVPIDDRGRFTFVIDAAGVDFGPTVRFQARCPAGITEWYTLGSEPLPFETRMSTALQIGGVSPDSIPPDKTQSAGAGVPVTVSGQALTPDCTTRVAVNDRDVELMNVHNQPKMLHGMLMRRDLDYRPVSQRFLDVQLRIRGKGFGNVASAHIRFVE